MIRIRKVPFLTNHFVELCTEKPIVLTNYQVPSIEETYYQSGNKLQFKDDWEKYQISLRMGNRIMDHFLLTNVPNKRLGEFPLYPVLTIVQTLGQKRERAIPILHKRGIERIYELLNPRKTHNLAFLAEVLLEQIRKEITAQMYGPSTIDDSILDILDECAHLSSFAHNESHADQVGSIHSMLQEINDLHYSGLRYSEFPTRPLIEEVLAPLFPYIPDEMTHHPVSKSFLRKREITGDDIKSILRKYQVEIDHTAELDKLMEQRMLMSDFDMDDVGYYPEFSCLYQTIIESGFTNIYLEYVFQEDQTKPNYLEWIPTKKSLEMINEYTSDRRDLEAEKHLIIDIEDIFLDGDFLRDISLDLETVEENEFDPNEMCNIKKIEVIVRDNSACVTVYSWALSCTAHIDFTVMALLSNSFITN